MIFSSSNTLLALVHLPGLEEDWTAASSSSIGIAARATPVDIPMFVPTTVLQDRAVKEDLTSLVACHVCSQYYYYIRYITRSLE